MSSDSSATVSAVAAKTPFHKQLTRELLVQEARDLLDAEGLDALTMRTLATRVGVICSPGEFYGQDGAGWIRLAAVQPDERIELAAARAGLSGRTAG